MNPESPRTTKKKSVKNYFKGAPKGLRLFVGGLTQATREEDLLEYFSQFGQVTHTKIKISKKKQYSKCYGFITCQDMSTKLLILQSEHYIKGKKVDVNLPIPKSNSNKFKEELYKRKIFIPNLDFRVTKAALKHYFEKYGEVSKVYKVRDVMKECGTKFIGYVEFSKPETREKVMNASTVHCIGNLEFLCQRYAPTSWKPDRINKLDKSRIREQVACRNFSTKLSFMEAEPKRAENNFKFDRSVIPLFKKPLDEVSGKGRYEENFGYDLWNGEEMVYFDKGNFRINVAWKNYWK